MNYLEKQRLSNREIEDARDWWHEELERKYGIPWQQIHRQERK